MTSNALIPTSTPSSKELFAVPEDQAFLRKKTLWDRPLHSLLGNNIIMSNSKSSRVSRWESAQAKKFTPLPVANIPKDIDTDTFEILLRKQRLNDINRRLDTNNFEDDDPDLRSPSPEPIYDSKTGKRLNTRLVLNKEKLLKEKNEIITELIQFDRSYAAPPDYKPPKKVKILYIRFNEKFNFTKYIIGPRGENQKKLEELSHCKITIRGKGSNWNNNSSYQKSYIDEQEPLHVCIQADNEEDLKKGEEMVMPLLDENSNEYKKMKIALTTNYYNSNEPACEFCGERGHKSWACPMNIGQFVKGNIKCRFCGDKGHLSCDCPFKPVEVKDEKSEQQNKIKSFLNEIDAFTESKSVPILQSEIKPNDIRKSVLMTGKVSQVKEEQKNENNTSPLGVVEKNEAMQGKKQQNFIPILNSQEQINSYFTNQGMLTYPISNVNLIQNKSTIVNPNIKQANPIQYHYVNMINQIPMNHMLYTQGNFHHSLTQQQFNTRPFFSNYQGKYPTNYNTYFPPAFYSQQNYQQSQGVSYSNPSGNKIPGFIQGKMTSINPNEKETTKNNNNINNHNKEKEKVAESKKDNDKEDITRNDEDEDDIKIE